MSADTPEQATPTGNSELHEIIERGRMRPQVDLREDDEILGYDAAGVPLTDITDGTIEQGKQ